MKQILQQIFRLILYKYKFKLYTSYQINAQISLFIYCYSPLHVSSSIMLILRRSNCMYRAYDIVTLYKWPCWSFSRQVERELSSLSTCLLNDHLVVRRCIYGA